MQATTLVTEDHQRVDQPDDAADQRNDRERPGQPISQHHAVDEPRQRAVELDDPNAKPLLGQRLPGGRDQVPLEANQREKPEHSAAEHSLIAEARGRDHADENRDGQEHAVDQHGAQSSSAIGQHRVVPSDVDRRAKPEVGPSARRCVGVEALARARLGPRARARTRIGIGVQARVGICRRAWERRVCWRLLVGIFVHRGLAPGGHPTPVGRSRSGSRKIRRWRL